MNVEQNFIDQVGLKETLRQLAATENRDAFAFLPFQLANEFRRLGERTSTFGSALFLAARAFRSAALFFFERVKT